MAKLVAKRSNREELTTSTTCIYATDRQQGLNFVVNKIHHIYQEGTKRVDRSS